MQSTKDERIELIGLSVAIGVGIGLITNEWADSQDLPWFAAHPELTGVIAFLLALCLGRVYLFMRRLESR